MSTRQSRASRRAIRAAGRYQPCWRCGRELDLDDAGTWEAGHRVDRALGGSDRVSNMSPECKGCNRRAGGKLGKELQMQRKIAARAKAERIRRW